jgi:uncharacterized membrane protein
MVKGERTTTIMFGFLFGTACLITIAALVRRRRRRWARGETMGHGCGHHRHFGRHWHHDHHDHHDAYDGGGGFPRWDGPPAGVARFIASRIDATPEQYRVIRNELETFLETARPLRREIRLSRDDVAKAMRTDAFDEEIMGESFARQDDNLTEVRKALVGALATIHDALDERQRARLASLLESGPRGFGPRSRGAW